MGKKRKPEIKITKAIDQIPQMPGMQPPKQQRPPTVNEVELQISDDFIMIQGRVKGLTKDLKQKCDQLAEMRNDLMAQNTQLRQELEKLKKPKKKNSK